MRLLVPLGIGFAAGVIVALKATGCMFEHYGMLEDVERLLQQVKNRQDEVRAATKGLTVDEVVR